MVTCISNHLFPWDQHLSSKVTTTALTLTIIAVAILATACAMRWGVVAYATLGSVSGLSLLTVCASITSRKIADNSVKEKEAAAEARRNKMVDALFECTNRRDIQKFKHTLTKYDKETISTLCGVKTLVALPDGSHLLLSHLLHIPDIAFFKAALEAFDNHTFEAKEYVVRSPLLDFKQDNELASLVIEKFDKGSLWRLFDRIARNLSPLISTDDIYSPWLDVLIEKWPREAFIREAVTGGSNVNRDFLIKKIREARSLQPDAKARYVSVLTADLNNQ